ncbi:hypothetical protein E2C01_025083 [Portunus trituberculatus]|uniref:Uncharacterized protein n=1 Tax=Portunus trituberculatus TaxID=210409 RepID=A0A5B7EEK7_PORTR|nr:hypothetical protein [Portunus trituberculatus]
MIKMCSSTEGGHTHSSQSRDVSLKVTLPSSDLQVCVCVCVCVCSVLP